MLRHEYEAADTWPKMVWQIIKPGVGCCSALAAVAFVPILGVMWLFGNAYIPQTSYVFAGALWALFMFVTVSQLDSWLSHRKDNGAVIVTLLEKIEVNHRIFGHFREDTHGRFREVNNSLENLRTELTQAQKHLDERLALHEKSEQSIEHLHKRLNNMPTDY